MTVPHMFALAATGVAGGITDPTDIANLEAWWDAADTGSITATGNSVTQWNDKSGNGLHLNQVNASPQTGTMTQNGLNVIDFNGSSQAMGITPAFVYDLGSMTFFAVVKAEVNTQTSVLCEATGTSAAQQYLIGVWDVGYFQHLSNGPVTEFDIAASSDLSDGSYHIMIADDSGTVARVFSDDPVTPEVTSATYARSGTGLNSLRIGVRQRNTLQVWFNGQMAELIIYSGVLSDADRQAVYDYLTDKWGL
jgi:hypothetical protein